MIKEEGKERMKTKEARRKERRREMEIKEEGRRAEERRNDEKSLSSLFYVLDFCLLFSFYITY